METPDPLIEFVKALARRRARLDATPPPPANQNIRDDPTPVRKP